MADVTDLTARVLTLEGRVDYLIALVERQGVTMSAQLDNLTAQVQRMSTVVQSVLTLVSGLAAQIEAGKDDPAKMQALADELKGDADQLAQDVASNTTAQP